MGQRAIDAIPKVAAARNQADYAAAVDGMLRVLGDPATHVVHKESDTAVAPDTRDLGRVPDPSLQTSDDVLIIGINHYRDLADFSRLMQQEAKLHEAIRQAKGVVFDLRSIAPLTQDERGNLGNLFDLAGLASELPTTTSTSPGERRRMHMGFPPQRGSTSGGYESAFHIAQGRTFTPAAGAPEVPLVFLINRDSRLPGVALALQSAGKAAIVAEGSVDDSLVVTTQDISMSDGVQAQIRLGELMYDDGTGGLQPNVTAPASAVPGDRNRAFQAALALAHKFEVSATTRKHLPASFGLAPDHSYADMNFPPVAYRLLAAFRVWTVIHYFFPYEDLMGEDLDGVFRQYIPRLENAANALEYHLAVAEMMTHVHDGHAVVTSSTITNFLGRGYAPVRLRMIEGVPVVTSYWNEAAAREAGIVVGDMILRVDGVPVKDRLAELAKYVSASTEQWLMRRAVDSLLRGPDNSTASVLIRGRNDEVKEVKLPRKASFFVAGASQRTGDPVRFLPGNIGYADLDRLTVLAVDDMFEKFKSTKAIIFDDRTYPLGTAWAIAPRLAKENGVVGAMFQRRVSMFPDFPLGDMARQSVTQTFFQQIPSTSQWRYKGKTVMLIDERTISQAEHTGLFFEAANGTRFIGSATAGANGDVTNFCVPGDIWINFTGQAVRHADGRQLQRIGLVPDVEVRPTIAGIRAGKDEVLDKAIEYLQK